MTSGQPRPGGWSEERGAPIGRRVLLGTLGLGALGVLAAPGLQRGLEADATMPPPPDAPPGPATDVHRFGRATRWTHRATAALMGACVLTAACLYVPQLAELVGRRALVVRLHEWAGLALPVPVLAGLASRAFRADLGRPNRFGPHDRIWLRGPAARAASSCTTGRR